MWTRWKLLQRRRGIRVLLYHFSLCCDCYACFSLEPLFFECCWWTPKIVRCSLVCPRLSNILFFVFFSMSFSFIILYFIWSMNVYIISSVMHAFWLVLNYDLLEDRRIDDVIIKTFLILKGCTSCATFLFLPHFDVLCDLLLNRRTATWNLFVNFISLNFVHWL